MQVREARVLDDSRLHSFTITATVARCGADRGERVAHQRAQRRLGIVAAVGDDAPVRRE